MGVIAFEVILVFLLIIANGVFAMSEMAIVSARKIRLQQLANSGDRAAQAALKLAESPDRFLSTVQIGITLIGILAGAFGGATIAEQIALRVGAFPVLAPYAEAVGLAVVVLIITYLSLIVGELVPKRIALSNPERIASLIARPMGLLSRIATPFVVFLSFSTSVVFKLLRFRPSTEPPVTEEEIKILIEQGTQAGVFEETEQDLVNRVFRLGDRRVSALMTPRPDVYWLDADALESEIVREMTTNHFSRYPVCRGEIDKVIGTVKAKDYLAAKFTDSGAALADYLKEPLFVPETSKAFQVLEMFKGADTHLAFVIDEYGAIQGVVTTNDFLEAIAGEAAQINNEEMLIVTREDGSYLVDGALPIDEFSEFFRFDDLPENGDFQTIAGFVLYKLGRVPTVAEILELDGLRIEIIDMDGRRIDKMLINIVDRETEIP